MQCKMCRFEVDPETGKCPLGHRDQALVPPANLVGSRSARTKRRKPRVTAVVMGVAIALALMYVLAIPGLLIGKTKSSLLQNPGQGSLTSDRQSLVDSCETAINGMKRAAQPKYRLDPVVTLANFKLARLPIPLNNAAHVIGRTLYRTADQYIGDSTIPDVELWQVFMRRDRYKNGVFVEFAAGPDHWNAVALDFGSPAQAADFQRSTIDAFCSHGLVKGLKQIPSLPGSFTLTRLDPTAPYRAFLLVGSSVIHLNICSCVEARDPIALVTRWAASVGTQFGLIRKQDAALHA